MNNWYVIDNFKLSICPNSTSNNDLQNDVGVEVKLYHYYSLMMHYLYKSKLMINFANIDENTHLYVNFIIVKMILKNVKTVVS